ncbi:Zincin [Pleurostoma richardsiae]|uniref:Zincin n=1 Tax=Pleurostoma richardsiae TaxID=41990 RepID=A0AA38RT63_9PEZI|nr:Zincin [Pleurostoma richardsiae]
MKISAGVCYTAACIHLASKYLQGLSPHHQQIDPCTDFDEFVCGGWRTQHNVPSGRIQIKELYMLKGENMKTLRRILESPYPSESATWPFSPKHLKRAMASIDEENFGQLQRAYNAWHRLDKMARLWPVEPSSYGANQLLGKQNTDLGAIIKNLIVQDRDTLDFLFGEEVTAGIIGLPTYINDALPNIENRDPEARRDAASKVLGALHPVHAARNISDYLATAVLQLHADVSSIVQRPKTSPVSVKELNVLAPQLGLERALAPFLPGNLLDKPLLQGYCRDIVRLLLDTPIDVIQTALLWKTILRYNEYVHAPELKPLEGVPDPEERDDYEESSMRCAEHVGERDSGLGWLASRFFVDRALTPKGKELGTRIADSVKQQLVARTKEFDWMDDETKNQVIQKIENMEHQVGYPKDGPNIEDPESLRRYYTGLDITDDFIDNLDQMSMFHQLKSLEHMFHGSHSSWQSAGHPAATNAWYIPREVAVVVPAAMMQSPAFGADLPSYINYGGFGVVNGHELAHGFDRQSRAIDAHGAYSPTWSKQSLAEIARREECFIHQYDNFTIEGPNGPEHVNGTYTLHENVVDAAGLSLSFNAWKAHRDEYPELHLPGLQFLSKEQLFYVAYGHMWCSKLGPEATEYVLFEVHAPASARINVAAMANSAGFKEAFNCPSKEPVCEIW